MACLVVGSLLTGSAKAITDTIFQYSRPKLGHYTLDPAAFAPGTSAYADIYHHGLMPAELHATNGNTGQTCFVTGANLPEAAAITDVAAWYQSDAIDFIQFYLIRNRLGGGAYNEVVHLSSTDTSATRQPMNLTPNSGFDVVDNQRYSYSATVCFGAGTTNNEFFGARITYTFTNAGD
jgi:hypothetical protein